MANATPSNVFSTIGTIMWSAPMIPQVWKSYREKSVIGLSATMMLVWTLCSFFIGPYVIVQRLSVPLILGPQSSAAISMISVMQCQYYGPSKWSVRRCVACWMGLMMVMGGWEVGMFYALDVSAAVYGRGRFGKKKGITAPIAAFGILATVINTLAIIPQYYEIYNLREVRGISLTFMALDIIGGIFLVIGLIFEKKGIDPLAATSHGSVVVLDAIVLILAAILDPRASKRRARAMSDEEATCEELGFVMLTSAQTTPNVTPMTEKEDPMVDKVPCRSLLG